MRVSCKPCAACRLLSRLRPRLACAEPSSTVYCSCHGSLALLATCSLGSCRALPAPSHLLTFIACGMPARAACHLLFRLTPRLACAEPSSKSYRLCRRSITLLVTCSFGSYSLTTPCVLVSHLACAEPPSNLYRSCHGSLTLLATCLLVSRRASHVAVLGRLLSFIASAMPASCCLPPALSARAASPLPCAAYHLCPFSARHRSQLVLSCLICRVPLRCQPGEQQCGSGGLNRIVLSSSGP